MDFMDPSSTDASLPNPPTFPNSDWPVPATSSQAANVSGTRRWHFKTHPWKKQALSVDKLMTFMPNAERTEVVEKFWKIVDRTGLKRGAKNCLTNCEKSPGKKYRHRGKQRSDPDPDVWLQWTLFFCGFGKLQLFRLKKLNIPWTSRRVSSYTTWSSCF